MSDPIVEIAGLSFSYGARAALGDISLRVEAGEIFGFLGPNGSGKTTLFRILSTLIGAPPGQVKILGLDALSDRDAIRRQIGVVFQSPSLDKQLTAEENLIHQGHLYGLRGPTLRQRAKEALATVGLGERSRELVGQFSGGMRRRVEVAKGLLHRPRLLLLDEPSTGLDPSARIDLWRHLRQINRDDGVTVLVTTHLMEEAERCTRLAVMQQGRLLACDSPAALKERVGGDVITITTSQPADVRALLHERFGVEVQQIDGALRLERSRGHEFVPQLIEAAPGLIDSVSVGKPTLEDVFIDLTGQRLENR
ncbi:MAG TPA: ATP-binding cassette domain-containing protein [Tepidisphaeraceae bacterium]|jgi:ABC-2 type transport system ATP-binding protein|nr:ATP-binding cassette domain-containing protein [Tepidisphaeraceae bacterium]